MWRISLLIIWYLFVCVLVAAATVISIARTYPSIYQNYLPTIQENISSSIGKPVQANAIHIDWYGYTPIITVNELVVYSDESKQGQLLFAKKAHLSIDLYKSLIRKKFSIHKLTLVGSDLEVIRTIDQRIILNGVDVGETITEIKKQNSKGKIQISLLSSAVEIKDKVKNLDYFFDRVNIAIVFNKDKLQIRSHIALPKEFGNSFVLVADVEGFDKGLNNIKGNLYAKGKNINLELLDHFFPQLRVGINAGHSDFEIWGNLKSTLDISLKGNLSFHGIKYNILEKPIIGISSGQEITALNTQFQIEGSKNNWNLTLLDSHFQTTDKKWKGSKYEINCLDCGEPNFLITAASDYID